MAGLPASISLTFVPHPSTSRVSARLHALPDHTGLLAGAAVAPAARPPSCTGHSGAATGEDDLGLCSDCWCGPTSSTADCCIPCSPRVLAWADAGCGTFKLLSANGNSKSADLALQLADEWSDEASDPARWS